MDLFYSPFTLTFDPSGTPKVLVTAGDFLTGWPRLDGEQVVAVDNLVGAASPFVGVMGNQTHKLEIPLAVPRKSARYALDMIFYQASAVRKEKKPATVAVTGGGTYTLTDCVATSWQTGMSGLLELRTLRLVFTAIAVTVSPPADT
jgi:hypothetical protein